jgi:hypothetical protein
LNTSLLFRSEDWISNLAASDEVTLSLEKFLSQPSTIDRANAHVVKIILTYMSNPLDPASASPAR